MDQQHSDMDSGSQSTNYKTLSPSLSHNNDEVITRTTDDTPKLPQDLLALVGNTSAQVITNIISPINENTISNNNKNNNNNNINDNKDSRDESLSNTDDNHGINSTNGCDGELVDEKNTTNAVKGNGGDANNQIDIDDVDNNANALYDEGDTVVDDSMMLTNSISQELNEVEELQQLQEEEEEEQQTRLEQQEQPYHYQQQPLQDKSTSELPPVVKEKRPYVRKLKKKERTGSNNLRLYHERRRAQLALEREQEERELEQERLGLKPKPPHDQPVVPATLTDTSLQHQNQNPQKIVTNAAIITSTAINTHHNKPYLQPGRSLCQINQPVSTNLPSTDNTLSQPRQSQPQQPILQHSNSSSSSSSSSTSQRAHLDCHPIQYRQQAYNQMQMIIMTPDGRIDPSTQHLLQNVQLDPTGTQFATSPLILLNPQTGVQQAVHIQPTSITLQQQKQQQQQSAIQLTQLTYQPSTQQNHTQTLASPSSSSATNLHALTQSSSITTIQPQPVGTYQPHMFTKPQMEYLQANAPMIVAMLQPMVNTPHFAINNILPVASAVKQQQHHHQQQQQQHNHQLITVAQQPLANQTPTGRTLLGPQSLLKTSSGTGVESNNTNKPTLLQSLSSPRPRPSSLAPPGVFIINQANIQQYALWLIPLFFPDSPHTLICRQLQSQYQFPLLTAHHQQILPSGVESPSKTNPPKTLPLLSTSSLPSSTRVGGGTGTTGGGCGGGGGGGGPGNCSTTHLSQIAPPQPVGSTTSTSASSTLRPSPASGYNVYSSFHNPNTTLSPTGATTNIATISTVGSVSATLAPTQPLQVQPFQPTSSQLSYPPSQPHHHSHQQQQQQQQQGQQHHHHHQQQQQQQGQQHHHHQQQQQQFSHHGNFTTSIQANAFSPSPALPIQQAASVVSPLQVQIMLQQQQQQHQQHQQQQQQQHQIHQFAPQQYIQTGHNNTVYSNHNHHPQQQQQQQTQQTHHHQQPIIYAYQQPQ